MGRAGLLRPFCYAAVPATVLLYYAALAVATATSKLSLAATDATLSLAFVLLTR